MKRAIVFIIAVPIVLAGVLLVITISPLLALILGALTLLGLALLSMSNALAAALRETGEVLVELPPSPYFERKQQLLTMIRSVQFEVKRSKLSESQAGELVARYRSELREVLAKIDQPQADTSKGTEK